MQSPLSGSILLIEDDRDVRDSMRDALEDEGFKVVCASDGREALGVLRAEKVLPRLILLDLMMPNMDGFEFREEQLRHPEWASIPVVVITAEGRVDERAGSVEAVGQIVKPVKLERLLEIARQFASAPA